MKNLTPELIAKAKAAQSAEELFELAKANDVEITEEEAKTYFEQLSANGTVSDDELDVVAGGCDTNAENQTESNTLKRKLCLECGAPFSAVEGFGSVCPKCTRKKNASLIRPY